MTAVNDKLATRELLTLLVSVDVKSIRPKLTDAGDDPLCFIATV